MPVRGLIGYRGQLLTDTRGTALLHQIGEGYGPWAGEVTHRTNGVLVADRTGTSNAYGLFNLQERAELFIGAGVDVYEGMVVGENSRSGDMDVNPTKEKKLTNIRTHAHDEALRLTPPRPLTLEAAIEFIAVDELVEVTPTSIRLRKRLLPKHDRRREARPRRGPARSEARLTEDPAGRSGVIAAACRRRAARTRLTSVCRRTAAAAIRPMRHPCDDGSRGYDGTSSSRQVIRRRRLDARVPLRPTGAPMAPRPAVGARHAGAELRRRYPRTSGDRQGPLPSRRRGEQAGRRTATPSCRSRPSPRPSSRPVDPPRAALRPRDGRRAGPPIGHRRPRRPLTPLMPGPSSAPLGGPRGDLVRSPGGDAARARSWTDERRRREAIGRRTPAAGRASSTAHDAPAAPDRAAASGRGRRSGGVARAAWTRGGAVPAAMTRLRLRGS